MRFHFFPVEAIDFLCTKPFNFYFPGWNQKGLAKMHIVKFINEIEFCKYAHFRFENGGTDRIDWL